MSVRRLAPQELQPGSFAFTDENLAWAKAQIAKYPEGRQASAVIPILWRAQEQAGGWVSEAAIRAVAQMLGMAYIRVLEVATFYTQFQLQPVGRKAHVQVCGTTPCVLRGSGELFEVCKHRIHHDPFHVSADGDFSWEEVECLGACVNAPMVLIGNDTYEDLTKESFNKVLDGFAAGRPVKPGPQNGRQFSAPIGGITTLKSGGASAVPAPAPTPAPSLAPAPTPALAPAAAAAPTPAAAPAPAATPAAAPTPAATPAPKPKPKPKKKPAKKPVIADAEAKKPGEAANIQERPAPKPPADDATGKTDKTS
jgi:NADH-quinone oxidoreductase subunit E